MVTVKACVNQMRRLFGKGFHAKQPNLVAIDRQKFQVQKDGNSLLLSLYIMPTTTIHVDALQVNSPDSFHGQTLIKVSDCLTWTEHW
jgi:hypothetical protein